MTIEYPHTIENGHGEKLTFLRVVEDEDGEFIEVTNTVQPGSGPPMHVHHFQTEALTVTAGRIGYQILGGPVEYGEVGDTVTFEPGVAHKFWAEGDEPLECEGFIRPPDNIAYFLTEIYRSTKESGEGRPDDFDAAFLMHRYRTEFDMLEIPGFVKAVVFPILRAVGTLTGRFTRFANAPTPRTQ